MNLLACSVFVILLAQTSVSQDADEAFGSIMTGVKAKGAPWCPPLYKCEGALQPYMVPVAPNLFPGCFYNPGRCRFQTCGKLKPHTKICPKMCYPKMVWKKFTCCRTYWVLATKKCKCRWYPFKVPPKPEVSEKIIDVEDNAVNKTIIDPDIKPYCPPLHKCEGALVDKVIYPDPDLFPQCKYNQRRCRKQRCGYPKKPKKHCPKICYPKMKWREVTCCRTFWRLVVKKCKCRKKPFPVPPKPVVNIGRT